MLSAEKCTTHCCFALFHSVDFICFFYCNSAIDAQESIAFRYPADLSLSAMIAVCGTIQTVTVAAFMERDASAWKIHRKGSLQLVAILHGVRTLPAYLVFFFFFLHTPRDHVRRESLFGAVIRWKNLVHTPERPRLRDGILPAVGGLLVPPPHARLGRRHPPWKVRSNPSSPFDLTSPCSMPPLPPVFLQQRWSQRACIFFCGRSLRIKRWRTEMRTSKLKGVMKNRCCERYPVWSKYKGRMGHYNYFCC